MRVRCCRANLIYDDAVLQISRYRRFFIRFCEKIARRTMCAKELEEKEASKYGLVLYVFLVSCKIHKMVKYLPKGHSPPQSLGITEVNKIFFKYFANYYEMAILGNILNLHDVLIRSQCMMVRQKWRKALLYSVFKMVSNFLAK